MEDLDNLRGDLSSMSRKLADCRFCHIAAVYSVSVSASFNLSDLCMAIHDVYQWLAVRNLAGSHLQCNVDINLQSGVEIEASFLPTVIGQLSRRIDRLINIIDVSSYSYTRQFFTSPELPDEFLKYRHARLYGDEQPTGPGNLPAELPKIPRALVRQFERILRRIAWVIDDQCLYRCRDGREFLILPSENGSCKGIGAELEEVEQLTGLRLSPERDPKRFLKTCNDLNYKSDPVRFAKYYRQNCSSNIVSASDGSNSFSDRLDIIPSPIEIAFCETYSKLPEVIDCFIDLYEGLRQRLSSTNWTLNQTEIQGFLRSLNTLKHFFEDWSRYDSIQVLVASIIGRLDPRAKLNDRLRKQRAESLILALGNLFSWEQFLRRQGMDLVMYVLFDIPKKGSTTRSIQKVMEAAHLLQSLSPLATRVPYVDRDRFVESLDKTVYTSNREVYEFLSTATDSKIRRWFERCDEYYRVETGEKGQRHVYFALKRDLLLVLSQDRNRDEREMLQKYWMNS